MPEYSLYLPFTPAVEPARLGLPTRFSGVAYSGGAIPSYGAHGDVAIDLASLRVPAVALFALVDHDPVRRAGKLTARITGNQLLVAGEFFATTEAGREVAALFSEGAPWQMSVGIQVAVEGRDRRSVTVNGRTLTVDTVFRNAVLREVSFVPVGADPETSVQAFAKANAAPRSWATERLAMHKRIIAYAERHGITYVEALDVYAAFISI